MNGGKRGTNSAAAVCAAVIFVSAFLLFQVQPLISKAILPWFGGSPAVWSSCLLFFQTALVGGYAYAHLLIRWTWPGKYWLHAALLAAAVCLLPILPSAAWKPPDGDRPTLRLLTLLAVNVGLPYFLLSSTGPLVQAWFARLAPERTPYRLYALSNFGSLLALLSYPFVFEPNVSLRGQGWGWSAGFVLFALLSLGLVWVVRTLPDTAESLPQDEARPTTWRQRGAWVGLAALASAALVAVTNHLCQDIAVVPFFWVVPLSVYLLSFIVCFEREAWYFPPVVIGLLLAAAGFIALCDHAPGLDRALGGNAVTDLLDRAVRLFDPEFHTHYWEEALTIHAGAYLLWFFALCVLCHGEMVRRKPARCGLTEFYLLISVGGALGGSVVTLLCPRIFHRFLELPICLGLSALVAAAVAGRNWLARPTAARYLGLGVVAAAVVGVLCAVGSELVGRVEPTLVARVRNFYGVISIHDVPAYEEADEYITIHHGAIQHGMQFKDEFRRDEPTTYYVPQSGVGVALRNYPGRYHGIRIGVVGLGSGGMAAHAREGDVIRFYEIDPQVIEIADKYFTYCKRCPGQVEIVPGDARLSMEREPPQEYDVLVLDAFTGDAIPVHLLTAEAIAVYARHLRPDGIFAAHISNRYLDLKPVILGAAKHLGWEARLIELQYSHEDIGEASSDWMLVTQNERFLNSPAVTVAVSRATLPSPVLWTDQRNDLLRILRAGR